MAIQATHAPGRVRGLICLAFIVEVSSIESDSRCVSISCDALVSRKYCLFSRSFGIVRIQDFCTSVVNECVSMTSLTYRHSS